MPPCSLMLPSTPPRQGHAQPSIAILSDSLAALYLVQRVVRLPTTLCDNKHQPLLHHICSFVLARATLGFRTSFHKVRAHTGVAGNERADAGAAAALANRQRCTYELPEDSHSLLPRINWLQALMPDRKRDAPPRMMFLCNLTDAVQALAEAAMPSHVFS